MPVIRVVASPLYARLSDMHVFRLDNAEGEFVGFSPRAVVRGLARSLQHTLDFIKIHSARQAVTRAADVQTDEQANRLTVLLQKAPSSISHPSGLYTLTIN